MIEVSRNLNELCTKKTQESIESLWHGTQREVDLRLDYSTTADQTQQKQVIMSAIGLSLQNNPSTRKLNVIDLTAQNVGIGTQGAQEISRGLQYNKTLHSMVLRGNELSYEELKILVTGLKENTTLHSLDLSYNTLPAEGMFFLSEFIKKNTPLHCLHLKGTNLSTGTCDDIVDALQDNTNIYDLTMNAANISYETQQELRSKLASNKERVESEQWIRTPLPQAPRSPSRLSRSLDSVSEISVAGNHRSPLKTRRKKKSTTKTKKKKPKNTSVSRRSRSDQSLEEKKGLVLPSEAFENDLTCKCILGDEKRAFTVSSSISFDDFKEKLDTEFDTEILAIKCMDEEGDFITMRTEKDLRFIINKTDIDSYLKLKLQANDEESSICVRNTMDDLLVDHKEVEILEKVSERINFAKWRGAKVACKQLRVSNNDGEEEMQELKILVGLRHPRIVLMMGVSLNGPENFLVMELMAGRDLKAFIEEHDGPFDIELVLSIATDIAQGMTYLHGIPMLHRNLCTSNILLEKSKNRAKLSDFAFSVQSDKSRRTTLSDDSFYTKPEFVYFAPEVMQEDKCTTKSDVYPFALILWQMILGKDEPKPGEDTNVTTWAVEVAEGKRLPIPEEFHPSLKLLVMNCWDHDPSKRPEFGDIVEYLEDMY